MSVFDKRKCMPTKGVDEPVKARRVVCPQPGELEIEEVVLESPGAGEILVETELTLISPGTERAWFLKEGDAPVRYPYRPGYCHVGEVLATGDGVTQFKAGDRVVSHSSHASAVLVREERATRIPEGVESSAAAFTILGAIALQGVRKAQIELGSSVGVIGAGLIGLFATQFSRLSGGYPVVVTDLSEVRRSRAARFGAHEAVPVEGFLKKAETHEQRPKPNAGFAAVIDATGHPSAFDTAVKACGYQGTVVLLGSTRGLADNVDIYRIHQKGVHIVGAHNRTRPSDQSYRGMWTTKDDTNLILKLMRDQVFSVADLITDEVSPEEVSDVFQRLVRRDESMLGCIIRWK